MGYAISQASRLSDFHVTLFRRYNTRTLSALAIGLIRLSLPRFASQAKREILKILMPLSKGNGLIPYCASP